MAVDTPRPSSIETFNTNINVTTLRKIYEPKQIVQDKKPSLPPLPPSINKTEDKTGNSSVTNKKINNKSSGICYANETEYEFVEANFNRILFHVSNKNKGAEVKTNVISNKYERENIIKYGNMLYEQGDYNELCLSQIYMVLIYTYYGMNLIEQFWDVLTFKHIRAYFTADQYKIAMKLMYDISSEEILDCYGEDIACKIRRSFLGLNKLE